MEDSAPPPSNSVQCTKKTAQQQPVSGGCEAAGDVTPTASQPLVSLLLRSLFVQWVSPVIRVCLKLRLASLNLAWVIVPPRLRPCMNPPPIRPHPHHTHTPLYIWPTRKSSFFFLISTWQRRQHSCSCSACRAHTDKTTHVFWILMGWECIIVWSEHPPHPTPRMATTDQQLFLYRTLTCCY